jgi:hypothetical protein
MQTAEAADIAALMPDRATLTIAGFIVPAHRRG